MSQTDDAPMDRNSVTLHPNYIEVIWRGEQTVVKVRVTDKEVSAAAKKLEADHKPLLASLQVVNHPIAPNMAAFAEVITVMQTIPFDRLVVCGDLPPTMMPLILIAIGIYNKQMEIKYVKKPEEALAWLTSNERGSRDP